MNEVNHENESVRAKKRSRQIRSKLSNVSALLSLDEGKEKKVGC